MNLTLESTPVMNPARMYEAGKVSRRPLGYSDKEVAEQIAALDLVIQYFEGRSDCQLMVGALQIEKNVFVHFMDARKAK